VAFTAWTPDDPHHKRPHRFPALAGIVGLILVAPVMAATPLNETRLLHPQSSFTPSTNHSGNIEIRA